MPFQGHYSSFLPPPPIAVSLKAKRMHKNSNWIFLEGMQRTIQWIMLWEWFVAFPKAWADLLWIELSLLLCGKPNLCDWFSFNVFMGKNDPAFDCVTNHPNAYSWYSTCVIIILQVLTKEKQKKKKSCPNWLLYLLISLVQMPSDSNSLKTHLLKRSILGNHFKIAFSAWFKKITWILSGDSTYWIITFGKKIWDYIIDFWLFLLINEV